MAGWDGQGRLTRERTEAEEVKERIEIWFGVTWRGLVRLGWVGGGRSVETDAPTPKESRAERRIGRADGREAGRDRERSTGGHTRASQSSHIRMETQIVIAISPLQNKLR